MKMLFNFKKLHSSYSQNCFSLLRITHSVIHLKWRQQYFTNFDGFIVQIPCYQMFLLNSEWYRNNSEILQCQHCLLSVRVLSVTSLGFSNAWVRSELKKKKVKYEKKASVMVCELWGSAGRTPRRWCGFAVLRHSSPVVCGHSHRF